MSSPDATAVVDNNAPAVEPSPAHVAQGEQAPVADVVLRGSVAQTACTQNSILESPVGNVTSIKVDSVSPTAPKGGVNVSDRKPVSDTSAGGDIPPPADGHTV